MVFFLNMQIIWQCVEKSSLDILLNISFWVSRLKENTSFRRAWVNVNGSVTWTLVSYAEFLKAHVATHLDTCWAHKCDVWHTDGLRHSWRWRTESDSIITHSDARPADVPAVKCVLFSPLPTAPVLLCNTEDCTYNDRSWQSALGDS